MLKNLFTFCLLLAGLFAFAFNQKPKPGFYQLKVYHLKDGTQEAQLDAYLQQAYLPALHRAGIARVGVFKTIAPAGNTCSPPARGDRTGRRRVRGARARRPGQVRVPPPPAGPGPRGNPRGN